MKTINNKTKLAIYLSSILLTVGCGEDNKSKDGKNDTPQQTIGGNPSNSSGSTVDADQPQDSTGAFGSVGLSFSTLEKNAQLALAETSSIDLGNGIVINDARVSIASVKLKASKEKSAAEKEFRKKLKEQKKIFEKQIETEKDAFEKEMEDLKDAFEQKKEGLGDDEIDSLKIELKADIEAVKKKMADLELTKDQREAEFEAEHDKNTKWKGPYLYNLISGKMSPELPEVQMVDGSYKRIEFKIKPNRIAKAGDAILNNSVVISGSYNDKQFIAYFSITEEFRLSGAGAFQVSPDGSNQLNVAFSLTKWFENVDLSTTVELDGEIVISDSTNKDAWDAIRKNMKRSTKFGKDEDGDGELGEDEDEGDGEENLDELEMEDEKEEEEDEEESEDDE